jgi:radical SAM protein with 4Fe4S-binding SPASM domain
MTVSTAQTTTVVRNECFGPLIWSARRNAYFIARDDARAEQLRDVLARRRVGGEPATPVSEIEAELAELGIEGPIRFVDSPYADRLSAPLEIYFDYTWVCNLAKRKCGQDSYCYAAEFLGKTTMQPNHVRELITELHEMGVMRLHLAGGEPTVNKRGLANYLDTAREFGMYTSMATNGLLLDDEIAEIILRNGLKSVSVSVDGATEETHAAVRGPGLFEKTLASIRRLVRLRDEAGSSTRVCIKPTYEPATPDEELERILLLGIELGVDVVKFANPERCLHHDQGHYGRQVDGYYRKLRFIEGLEAKYGHLVGITNVNNPLAGCGDVGLPGLEGCIGGQELLAINPDGSATPCLMHPHQLGNVLVEYDGIRDFWTNAQTLPEFWSALRKPTACNDCSIYSRCRSGSTTRRIVEVGKLNRARTSGDFATTKDPLCPRDYLDRHPEMTARPPRRDPGELVHLREVAVRHSL